MVIRPQTVTHFRIIPHILRDRSIPQLIAFQEPELFLARFIRGHWYQSRKMFDRSLEEIALEAVAEPSQCLRIRADMYSTTQHWSTAFLDAEGNIVAHLQQSLFFVWDIHALHQAANGGDKGVVARP
ncbi:hypothetical protein N7497_004862 [Penicillium chrysogenum]|nr:hypothetical protein N7497_004862 [Penicillium chrysogenum]